MAEILREHSDSLVIENSSDKMEHRVLFRDILRRDKKIRLEYETLKLKLSQAHLTDRELYTDKKGEFIKKVLCEKG
ncbi:GrpB family protein [Rickettsiella endosymbiont of Dermanyssus gallinae]|uniref:GrpB family protein n=1 Tax=Rickettsiella endosymbiont of Dermanyssus gallinae TaxID=2856608 RepID=UPI001C52DC9E|nr:GrpB family protein [Rickettsiella endosymbiont of Dermanyssus gallinae]